MKIRVTDPVGAEGIAKVLVLTRSLDRKGEVISRELSDADGFTPPIDLPPGLYQAVATFPFGGLSTRVQEFVLADNPKTVELHMFGGTIDTVQATVKVEVTVVDRAGHPVANATVLGRDPEAKFMDWSRTDGQGHTTVTIGVDTEDIVTLYGGQVDAQRISIPYHVNECTDLKCIARAGEALKETPQSITVHLQ